MIVFNENYKSILPLFKQTADQSSFLSFDSEMTGVTLSPETDCTKYDTQQSRYLKTKQVVSTFNLLQFGITFYIPSTIQENSEQNYIERTFTFYLFKNSSFKSINTSSFNSNLTCNPSALKFLNENNFDLNTLVNKGIHYNKLKYKDKLKQLILNENSLSSSSGFFLSKTNEQNLIEVIIQITEFLLKDHDEGGNNKQKKKPSLIYTLNSKQTMTYLLGCNLKKILFLSNFSVNKDKSKENTIIVEKTKKQIPKEDFIKRYENFDNFKQTITNNLEIIYQNRFQIILSSNDSTIDDLVNNELGFSIFIEYLISKQIPIIGHNIYMDLMFIYDKLIDDLPEDFYEYKQSIHKCFPIIYDTKTIATALKKYDNTKLESLYKSMIKHKYNSYVNISMDVSNGFSLYNDLDNKLLHDAGYDSLITGRCFIFMNKALQNEYKLDANIKKGFIDFGLFELYKNKSEVSLIDCVLQFDTDIESKEDFNESELKLIKEKFKNVCVVFFNQNKFDHVVNIYEIANMFQNDYFDYSIVKSGFYSAFIEITNSTNYDEKKPKELIEGITDDRILNIVWIEDYYKKYKYSNIKWEV